MKARPNTTSDPRMQRDRELETLLRRGARLQRGRKPRRAGKG